MWQPTRPLTAAERRVDFPAHDSHINDYQHRVEKAAQYTLKRIASSMTKTRYAPLPLVQRLEGQLVRELDLTAMFGYTHAQREIATMRAAQPARARRAVPRAVPDAGQYGRLAQGGLPSVFQLIRIRAHDAMLAVVTAAAASIPAQNADTQAGRATVLVAATKQLHRSVIELVGETLNLGRTVGALRYPRDQGGPPEYAMRSEQLDPATCAPCDQLHGEITQVGSSDYYDLLPPSYCSGGGRCRGIEVYGDGRGDLSNAL